MGLQRLRAFFDWRSWTERMVAVRERWFDLRHGLDTVSIVHVAAMRDVPEDAARHAVQYEATPIHKFRRALSLLDLDPAEYSFVDFGSGKGRVLLLAAGYPFKQVIGVEVSAQLHHVAQANARAFRRRHSGCPPIHCVCSDVRQFEPPEGNLLAFLYNPFDAEVMDMVLDRIFAASLDKGGALAIVYINPLHYGLIDSRGRLSCLAMDSMLAVYQRA